MRLFAAALRRLFGRRSRTVAVAPADPVGPSVAAAVAAHARAGAAECLAYDARLRATMDDLLDKMRDEHAAHR